MKFETMGYRNLENPQRRTETMGYSDLERSQRRTETNEYSDTFRDLLLPGEKWDDLTWKEQGERIDAYRDGTIEELLEKKLEEREKDTSTDDALRQLAELRAEIRSDRPSHTSETSEERLSKSQKAMMEIEKKLERMKENVYGKQNIEQKVVNGEFVEIPDDKAVSIQERKTEQMAKKIPATEPIVGQLTDLPTRNTNSVGTINGNVASTQESKSTETLISEIDDEEVLDIPQLNQNTSTPAISKLDDFAKMVEEGQLLLEDAIEYLDLDDIEDIVKSHGSNDMDLLQIAISNNYGNLYNQIINGIDIETTKIRHVPGHQYARVNGSSTSSPPRRRRVTNKEHINLFNRFDMFRKDGLGKDALSYALNNSNQDMFYSMVAECNDSKLTNMTFKSPLLQNNWPEVDLLSFLMDSYVTNGNEKLFSSIEQLVKNKDLYENLFFGDGYTIPLLIGFNMRNYPDKTGQKKDAPYSKLLDLIVATGSKEERTYIWQYVVEEYFEDKQLEKRSAIEADNLLNFMNKMLQSGVDIERKDLDLINSFNFNLIDLDKHLGEDNAFLASVNQKRNNLFNCDISRLETLTGKSPDVLRAVLGENYLEQLKGMIEKEPTNIDAFRNAIIGKWDTERNSRLFLFQNVGELVGVPNKDGHTLFSLLTSEEIVEIFDKFNPVLSNEAVMDIAEKPVFRNTNGKYDPIAVKKVYDAIYDYVPTENIEDFCNKMLPKTQIDNDSLFDFHGGIDFDYDGMSSPEYEMAVDSVLKRFSKFKSQKDDSYANKIQKMKDEAIERRKAEQQKKSEDKEMYVTMQDLAKQNKDLRAENERLRMMIAKLQGMENNPNQSSK